MAGVPMVMQAMAGTLTKERLPGGRPVRSLTIGAFLGESQVAQDLEELQSQHPAVDIGSYPFFREAGYGTNLVARGTDPEELASIGEALKVLIENHGAEPHEGGV